MVFQKYIRYAILLLFPVNLLFAQSFSFKEKVLEKPDMKMPFTVKNTIENKRFLEQENVTIKNENKEWIYITSTPKWMQNQLQEKKITDIYFEYAPPALLDDTARVTENVDPVHSGDFPLVEGYTGKGVILGLVDDGLDYRHPDFITEDGKKRVIRYWDQSETNPTRSPEPYGYGQIWYADEIQNENTTNNPGGHGTTVTGIAAGNGLANGRNKGMAPEAEIVFVETDFNLENWTLTVADACDFIFRIADSLEKPAVINLSVGSYLGSHDGKDPASMLMENLVDEKEGRIIIGAAGNGGKEGKYHAQQIMSETDTNFIWLENAPNGQLGENTAFFDLWTDVDDATFHYSFGANNPADNYANVGATTFRPAQINVGTPYFDTLWNANGDRIATLEVYTGYMSDVFHMQAFFSTIDSTDYLMRFSTTGMGKYDLWSGEWMALNKLVDDVPSPVEYPPIKDYVMPDNNQSIVSSWNCSPKIVSVGNVRSRYRYKTYGGDYYYHADDTPPGKIALSSSKGPARSGIIKPEIVAPGDMNLASVPMNYVENATYSSTLDEMGWHGRNNGTSMASPVIAGIAALYLERCPKSTYQTFIEDLTSNGYEDNYTGATPNNLYGYGKVDAHQLISSKNQNLEVAGEAVICQKPAKLTSNIPLLDYEWYNGNTDEEIIVPHVDTVYLQGIDEQGCKQFSDTVIVIEGSDFPNPVIYEQGDSLVSSEAPNYQWYFNGDPISGATQQSYKPTEPGYYSVAVQDSGYCKSFSDSIGWVLSTAEEWREKISLYPNPTHESFTVDAGTTFIHEIEIYTALGQKTQTQSVKAKNKITVNVEDLARGSYFIKLKTSQGMAIKSFFKE